MAEYNVEYVSTLSHLKEWKWGTRENASCLFNVGMIMGEKFNLCIRPSLNFQNLACKVEDLLQESKSFHNYLKAEQSPKYRVSSAFDKSFYATVTDTFVRLLSWCLFPIFISSWARSLTCSHLLNILHGCLLALSRELIIKNPNSILGSLKDACCVLPGELNSPNWCSYPKKQDRKGNKLGPDVLACWFWIPVLTVWTLFYIILSSQASF